MILSDSLGYEVNGIAIDNPLDGGEYKIVTFIDSGGCTPCQMKLTAWSDVMNQFKTLIDADIRFAMILNTKKSKGLEYLLKYELFKHPVCFDSLSCFIRGNDIPRGSAYHTFLLDSENKILAVGNPAVNPKIKDFYWKILTDNGELEVAHESMCEAPSMSFGVAEIGDTVVQTYRLLNQGDKILTLQSIVPSCDCISAVSDRSAVNCGDEMVITSTFIPDSLKGSIVRFIDVYFNEKETPERLLLYGIIN